MQLQDAQFQHPLDRRPRAFRPHVGFVELAIAGAIRLEAMPELLQRVQTHVGAGVATAAVEPGTS